MILPASASQFLLKSASFNESLCRLNTDFFKICSVFLYLFYKLSKYCTIGSTFFTNFNGRSVDCCTCQTIATHQILNKQTLVLPADF